jgi:pantoate--beta-alanine ligase
MHVARSLPEWRSWRREFARSGGSLGFVPTMGALHAGHAALLQRARAENDAVALSIFVNPTQFDDPADLAHYPRTWEADLTVAAACGVDAVLAPARAELYPDDYTVRVTENHLSRRLEGTHRPGHFDGVLTVVLKLLQLVAPDRAYFGEKDLQQLLLVQQMASAFFLPCAIVACPTVRDADGVALSSRNARLTPAGRERAAEFARLLREHPEPIAARLRLAAAGFEVDYVEALGGRCAAAVRIDGVRLLDNVPLAPVPTFAS